MLFTEPLSGANTNSVTGRPSASSSTSLFLDGDTISASTLWMKSFSSLVWSPTNSLSLVFSTRTWFRVSRISAMNRFGSSLVWGHPQAPTGARLIIELIEELAQAGGGYGLFTGCAAGDTALAVVVKVD